MSEPWVRAVLGREESNMTFPRAGRRLRRVLVTGGEGSLGSAMTQLLEKDNLDVFFTDIDTMDVRDERNVMTQFLLFQPETVLHFAASKHAPFGEEDPYEVVRTNVEGTRHVLEWSRRVGARCVVASTCKACDPETAYGASKLIAERMALNAGQAVARYYNVVETSGNVFEIWKKNLENDEPLG